jgi:hypothetical protein
MRLSPRSIANCQAACWPSSCQPVVCNITLVRASARPFAEARCVLQARTRNNCRKATLVYCLGFGRLVYAAQTSCALSDPTIPSVSVTSPSALLEDVDNARTEGFNGSSNRPSGSAALPQHDQLPTPYPEPHRGHPTAKISSMNGSHPAQIRRANLAGLFATEACEYWARIWHGPRLINFTSPIRGPMKSCLTRHFGTSHADDHEIHMTSLVILVIWVFE